MTEESKALNRKPHIEILGLIILVFSVVFVGYELYQARQLSVSERLTAAAETEASLRELVASNSDVWHRGCADEELSDPEEVVFRNTILALLYRSFTLWHISQTGTSSIPPTSAIDRMARSVAHYPGFRRVLLEVHQTTREGGIDLGMVAYLDAALARAEHHRANSQASMITCGW